jgi:hypothetical protein
MRKAVAAIAVVALVALGTGLVLVIQGARSFLRSASFTKSVEVNSPGQDRAIYYRLKVKLAYKGEPLDFDIVVGCNVIVTTYKDNDRSFEVGIAPMVYGLKMKDGRGVVVQPPEACNGETTENGKVPAALLPRVVTYENADQPWFGLAYSSEDAYDSPISELKFFSATISKATREEWQEWRRTEAPKNFVTYELLGINRKNIWDNPHWRPNYRAMGSICTAFSWVRLPEVVREAIRPYWPASKPRYWYPNLDAERAFRKAGDYDHGTVLFEGNPLQSYSAGSSRGLPRHGPGAVISYKDWVTGALYPAKSDLSFNRLDDNGELPAEIKAKSKKSYAEAEIDPKLKGFAYCDRVRNIDGQPSAVRILPPEGGMQPLVNRINGEAIDEELQRIGTNFGYAFERDEYVIFYKSHSLVDIFGGL